MRNERIDSLRFFGVLLIMLAHVQPPELLFQWRNFDVVLLVMLAGASYGLSYQQRPYFSYLWQRLRTLILPVWLFLSFYFGSLTLLAAWHIPVSCPTLPSMLKIYVLLSGIGYIWIFRIFMMLAALAPALYALSQRMASKRSYFLILCVCGIVHEVLLFSIRPYLTSIASDILECTVFSLVPYALVFAFGLYLPRLAVVDILVAAVFSGLVFCGYGLFWAHGSGHFIPIQVFKYPPSLYYISYGVLMACLAWLVSPAVVKGAKHWGLFPAFAFVSRHSVWIYLWHIPFIGFFMVPWYEKWPLVVCLACGITFIQCRALKWWRATLSSQHRLQSYTKGPHF